MLTTAPGTVRNVAAGPPPGLRRGDQARPSPHEPDGGRRPAQVVHREQLFLNPAQVHDLAGALPEHWSPLVLTAAFTGLRAGELAGLRRRDVGLLRGTLRVEQAVQEVGGRLHTGPPKTPRPRRTVALRSS